MFEIHCASRTKEQNLGSSFLIADAVFHRKDRSKAGAVSGCPFLSQNIKFQAHSSVISKTTSKKQEKVGLIRGHLESSSSTIEGGPALGCPVPLEAAWAYRCTEGSGIPLTPETDGES